MHGSVDPGVDPLLGLLVVTIFLERVDEIPSEIDPLSV